MENEGRGRCPAKLPALESSWSQGHGPLPPSLCLQCGCPVSSGSAAAQTHLNSCTPAAAQVVLLAAQQELESISTQSAPQSEEGRYGGSGWQLGRHLQVA